MAISVACVHLKMAHAALPALLPTPPKWKMLPVLPTPCIAAVLPKPLANAKPSRADADERWDACKTMPGHGSSPRKKATSPPPKPGQADTAERWDANKKAAIPASSLSPSSGTSSIVTSTCKISRRTSSSERWDMHKKRRSPQTELLNDGESSSTGSNNIDDTEEEEEIVWKPRAEYAGPGFVAAAPVPSMLPVPTAFLVRVA